jgi:hypothetical protein
MRRIVSLLFLQSACALSACALSACANAPDPRTVELDACQRDPLCSGKDAWTPDERCVVRRGCPRWSARRLELPLCASSEAAVRVEKFVESPEAFALPVTLSGRLEVRPACDHNQSLYEQPCGPGCYGFMAMVASFDERDRGRRKARAEMSRRPRYSEVVDRMVAEGRRPTAAALARAEGVALVRADGGPVGCVGDSTAICCEVPLDGRDVRATFARRLERPLDLPSGLLLFRQVDYDKLVLERICAVETPL